MLEKQNFRQNLIDLQKLELLEVSSNLHGKYSIDFYEKCPATVFGV